jgi:hypothetical protein
MPLIIPGRGPRWSGTVDAFTRREHATFRRGLIGAWLFDEGVGAFLNDQSRQGARGTLSSGLSWDRAPWGPAVSFPTPTTPAERITCVASPALKAPNALAYHTIMALIFPKSFGSAGANPTVAARSTIFDMGVADGNSDALGPLKLYIEGAGLRIACRAGTGPDNYGGVGGSNNITLNTWQMVGFTCRRNPTFAPTVFEWKGYHEGKTSAGSTGGSLGATLALSTSPVIGARAATLTEQFEGLIAGVWLWNYGMTPGEVARFTADPFGAWRFDPTGWARSAIPPPPAPTGGGVPAVLRRRYRGI